jgi:hypothetical protein
MSSLTDNKFFRWEFTVDTFAGVIMGLFPDDEPIIYEAIVKDHKVEMALNFTANLKVQVLNYVIADLEIEFTPVMATAGLKSYSTTFVGDNCLWVYSNYHVA